MEIRMKVLVVGSGGREHALVWKIAQSSLVDQLFCAPGNPGIGQLAENVPIKAEDIDGIVTFAVQKGIDLVVVGPEDPLAMGMVDRLQEKGIRAFGPNASAARIEADKAFTKGLMAKYGIPTADFAVFDQAKDAYDYLDRQPDQPIVVKHSDWQKGKVFMYARIEPLLKMRSRR
jgi:phosphoribosylamine--glycine ligase